MDKHLVKIILGGVIFAIALFINSELIWLKPAVFLISYLIVGGDIVMRAMGNITKGEVFDENFLMSVATIGAIIIGEYPEGVAVMLFYQIGEYFQDYAANRSRRSISDLMDIRPDYANVKRGDEIVTVDPQEIRIGDVIVIKPGEKIPIDGKVLEGRSMIDTSALTGESVPREVEADHELISGCININGVIIAEVTKEFGESTVNKILDLVENAGNRKSNSEKFITKFARYYTPVVVFIAVLLAIVPPLVFDSATFSQWVYRALTFLVVSCPCALVVSIPLSFFGGIGGASRAGILVKGGNYLESLAQAETIVFDKTGTLTKGVFEVQKIHSKGIPEEELLELTAHAENYSNHPISQSLKRAYGKSIDNSRISELKEIPGKGVQARVDGRLVAAGNFRLMESMGVDYSEEHWDGTTVHVAIDGEYAGFFLIADELKEDAGLAISRLKELHIKKNVMLTGDTESIGRGVAETLGMDEVHTELLPADKVEKVEEFLGQKTKTGKLVFVGDGINDAPVLARADIGIAMGGLGSDAAIEAADIVIMTDEPSKVAVAIGIAKNTLNIARQNTVFAISVKFLVLILSGVGLATMWAAVFADVGVTFLAVLNSFRTLRVKKF
ncbi:MAG: cadmium-translocating P-type ATPase, partial [Clostridiales Family XIII bacterium]|nr:cadmium-translocating P-type ATPase [Clostridiales Family XIII bacterium]